MAEAVTRVHVNFYSSPRAGKLAILTLDNGEDYRKPNTLSMQTLESLEAALAKVDAEGDVRGLLLTGKPFGFAAGADINMLASVTDRALAAEAARRGHQVLRRLREAPYPTLAAVNGVCLGGGLEVALWCQYRTLVEGTRHIGFPEVFLNILPGWGGTQLTPRLVGVERAIILIVENPLQQNRLIDATQALEMGLVDRVLPAVEFLDDSLSFLEELVTGEAEVERKPPELEGAARLVSEARGRVDSRVHGAALAPYRALELILATAERELEEGLALEAEALADLVVSRQAKASFYSFDLVNRRAKRIPGRPEVPPKPVKKVGVVGAGLMGSQIASLFVRRLQVPVVMKDVDLELAERGASRVRRDLEEQVARGRLDPGKARFLAGIVRPTDSYSDFADADLVIEAVLEDMDLKKRVFREVEEVVSSEAVLATNTSSLSVTEMASALEHPERVVGIHFFNPVHVMPLVEVIRGEATDDLAMATAFWLTEKLGKTGVPVGDAPAFVVNRVLTAFMGVAVEAADSGTPFHEVDEALLSLGIPMAPFDLLGLVGPGVAYHVGELLHRAWPDRFPISENLRRLAESRKPGVYRWVNGRKEVDPEVDAFWQKGERSWSREEIVERALERVAREVALILEEGVASAPEDVDTCMILGAGWPFFMGGITPYLDETGVSERVLGRRFRPH